MDKVNNVVQALQWFISHSSESVLCQKGREERVFDNYPAAEKYYKER